MNCGSEHYKLYQFLEDGIKDFQGHNNRRRFLALTDVDFLVTSAQNCKKCITFDNLKNHNLGRKHGN